MHIAEGILPLSHAAGWALVAAPAVVIGARRLARAAREGEPAERALVTMAGAIAFAVTLFPVPVPVAGATSHLCATPLLALLLGPRLVAAPAAMLLLLQALFFAHGGLTSLGANVLTLGVVGPAAAFWLARGLRRAGASPVAAAAVGCALGDLAVYVADAGILALGLSGEAPPLGTFAMVLAGFAPVQVPLAILEGLLSAAALRALAARRPELVPAWLRSPGVPAVAAAPLVVLALALGAAPAVAGCSYRGLDDAVISGVAARAGRPPRPGLLDPREGELGLMVSVGVLFGAGFAAGAGFQRLSGGRHAPRR